MSLSYPLNNQEKGSIEGARFAKLQAKQFKGGLPVFTINRDITITKPQQNEMWVESLGGSNVLYDYYNGEKKPITPLFIAPPVYSTYRNLVDDTPQPNELWIEFMAGSMIAYTYYNNTKYTVSI